MSVEHVYFSQTATLGNSSFDKSKNHKESMCVWEKPGSPFENIQWRRCFSTSPIGIWGH